MIDPKLIAEQKELVRQKLQYRLKDASLLDRIEAAAAERRKTQKEADDLRHRKKDVSREIGILKSKGQNADELFAQSQEIGGRLEALETREKELNGDLENLLLYVPNLPQDGVPEGADETANRPVKSWGEPGSFSFKPKTHFEIAEKLGILDFERGAKISGSGFTLYHGPAARLERSLINFMLDTHAANGYREQFVPFLVTGESLRGTGQLPKFQEDLYRVDGENLYLNPTAEVPLTNMFQNETLKESDLPLRVTAYAPSFRREAGSYGKDTRGIIRQHQFNKVELVKFTRPEESAAEHESMLADAERILQLLELPYRVIVLSAGDMGFAASKCYDIEVWIPSLNGYKEISSVSNCLDFQARRAGIRFRRESTGKTEFVHTLNGSGLAVGRTLVAILENCQNEDGSVEIPKALRPYYPAETIRDSR